MGWERLAVLTQHAKEQTRQFCFLGPWEAWAPSSLADRGSRGREGVQLKH